MPRKYDRLIKFYDSLFDDLLDEAKGFTPEEILCVLLAIRNAQRESDISYLDNMPREIRRGLQMATLREQVTAQIEKNTTLRNKGLTGAIYANMPKGWSDEQKKLVGKMRYTAIEKAATSCNMPMWEWYQRAMNDKAMLLLFYQEHNYTNCHPLQKFLFMMGLWQETMWTKEETQR